MKIYENRNVCSEKRGKSLKKISFTIYENTKLNSCINRVRKNRNPGCLAS